MQRVANRTPRMRSIGDADMPCCRCPSTFERAVKTALPSSANRRVIKSVVYVSLQRSLRRMMPQVAPWRKRAIRCFRSRCIMARVTPSSFVYEISAPLASALTVAR